MLTLTSGPHQGVRNTTEPFDDTTDYLVNASNGYFRDPESHSGFLARPGFTLRNSSAELGPGSGETGAHAHVDPATGTIYRFYAAGGKLYRADSTNTTFTDVTPVAVVIDATSTFPFAMASVGASMVCSDGVHRPWVASDFAATPITGTYISINGAADDWSAFGPPTIYQDCVMWITATVPALSNITPRVGIVWSEPNQPDVGYTQPGYNDFWNVIENATDALYALWGTNVGVFYWREQSIGVLAGTPNINFSTTATRDARSSEIGTTAPFAIAQFGSYIYFVDLRGRPYRMSLDGAPEPIWNQLPAVVNAAGTGANYPDLLTVTAVGEISVETQQWIVAIWSPTPGSVARPTTMYAFDGRTGTYAGAWQINPAIGINRIGRTRSANGATQLVVMGGKTAGNAGGYVWLLSLIADANWKDNGAVPVINVTSGRVGYSADTLLNTDTATLLTMSQAPLTVTVQTPYTTSTMQATAFTPSASQDGVYRTVIGLDAVAARGLTYSVTPTTADSQWGFQQMTVRASAAVAGPEDQ